MIGQVTKKSDDKKNKLSKLKKNTTETPAVKGMFSLKHGLKRCKDFKYSKDCKTDEPQQVMWSRWMDWPLCACTKLQKSQLCASH